MSLLAPRDLYDAWAGVYDEMYFAHDAEMLTADVPFFMSLAAERPGEPLLELACGTGRVLLPLAREAAAGRGASRVVGLDLSGQMLDACRRKLEAEPEGVRACARLVRGDMTRFSLRCAFGLVIVPFHSLNTLPDQAGQIAALRAMRDALAPGGRAVVPLFAPPYSALEDCRADPHPVAEYVERATGETVRYQHHARIDPIRQTIDDTLEEERARGDGRVARRTFHYRLRFIFFDEMRLMAEIAGLDIEATYGWFDGRPVDAGSREMIFILRKP